MEIRVSRQTITGWQTVLETGGEQTIEAEFVLPDYQADVQRILRCQPNVSILGRQVGEEKITVSGSVLMRILYLSAEGELQSATKSMDFKKVLETRHLPEDVALEVRYAVRQSRCRAINPRKLEAFALLSFNVKGYSQRGNTLISTVEGGGVEVYEESVTAKRMLGYAEKQVTLSDELELGQGKPSVQRVLDSSIYCIADDCRVIPNKAIVKGEVVVHLLYIGDVTSGQPEQMDFSLPVSQVVDFEGLSEESDCEVSMEVMTYGIHPRTEPDGSCRRFAFDAVVSVHTKAAAVQTTSYISDAYSREFESKQTYSELDFERVSEQVRDQKVVRNTIDTSARPIAKVLDQWTEVLLGSVSVSGGEATVSGVIMAALLVQDELGESFMLEREFTYEQNYGLKERLQKPTATGELVVVSQGFSFTEGNIELRTEIKTRVTVFDILPINILSGIEVDQTAPKPANPAALVLCYAGRDEKLWDIAKHYNTSMNAIMEENGLETPQLETSVMLMIPRA